MKVAIFFRGLAAAAFAASRAHAQTLTGIPAVDSATVARAAWARAAAALQIDDMRTALDEVVRAARAWPIQPSYAWAHAVLAARARDTTSALDALGRYASLGLGRDLRGEASFAWLASVPGFERLAAAHDANRAPLARSRVVATLRDSTLWPEGMDVDPRTKRYFVASAAHRTIVEIDANGRERELIPRDRRDVGPILGVRFDPKTGDLWATTSAVRSAPGFVDADTLLTELLRIRVRDGSIVERISIPTASGPHTLGDLAIGPTGDVLFTDSSDPVLYRLRRGATQVEAIRSPLLRSPQSVAPTPDGRTVFVADYSHGLLRVDLATLAVTRLDDAPNSTSLGCDGIAWDDRTGAVIAIQNGVVPARVMRFAVDAERTRITRADVIDRNTSIADEPTIGAIVGREFIYVANSQWEKYDAAGRRVLSRPLRAPVLLAIPLP